jgi:hypothetical protein
MSSQPKTPAVTKTHRRASLVQRLVRPLCWPFMAVFELLLLALGWGLALRWPAAAEALTDWATTNLPDPSWYWPNT